MILLNPKKETFDHLGHASKKMMSKTIAYFESRGKKLLKHNHHERIWHDDFI